MRESWLKLVDGVLCPARPRLEPCVAERERYLAVRRVAADQRARAVADCVARIEAARAEVFAARDGVVSVRMTALEREWRTLSRSDEDGALMDLWARIAPSSWIDRKRWRDADPARRVDAAVALASDVDGVEGAETAIRALRRALAPWNTSVACRIRWRPLAGDFEGTAELLGPPLRAAREALSVRDGARLALEGARKIERAVERAARARFPERAVLARALAHAAYVDVVWRAASFTPEANPVTPLRQLWQSGYVLSSLDARDVTLELPLAARPAGTSPPGAQLTGVP
jgi:hypothetical protein